MFLLIDNHDLGFFFVVLLLNARHKHTNLKTWGDTVMHLSQCGLFLRKISSDKLCYLDVSFHSHVFSKSLFQVQSESFTTTHLIVSLCEAGKLFWIRNFFISSNFVFCLSVWLFSLGKYWYDMSKFVVAPRDWILQKSLCLNEVQRVQF